MFHAADTRPHGLVEANALIVCLLLATAHAVAAASEALGYVVER